MLPITTHLLKPIVHLNKDDTSDNALHKPLTEADVCQRIQVLLTPEQKDDDEDGMMMRGVEQHINGGMERREEVKMMSEFKESELSDVSNHLERLRNEKFNPQIDVIGQMLSSNLDSLRNTKKKLDK